VAQHGGAHGHHARAIERHEVAELPQTPKEREVVGAVVDGEAVAAERIRDAVLERADRRLVRREVVYVKLADVQAHHVRK
jgi:hypothetical protein